MSTEAGRAGRSRRGGVLRFVRDVAIIFVVAVLVSFLVKTFVIRSFYIPSGSMENTLQINDRIFVNELEPTLMPLHHGDVIVFTDPGGWLNGEDVPPVHTNPVSAAIDNALTFVGLSAGDSNNHLVKRVIGLPGDHVSCCNAKGQTSVNGVALHEPYTRQAPLVAGQIPVDFRVTVPRSSVWVEGDNRYNSLDSRFHQSDPTGGFVPERDIVGRAILIFWPIGHWTWLGNHPTVYADIPKP